MTRGAPRKHRQRVKDIIEALCNKLLDDQALLKLLSQSTSALIGCLEGLPPSGVWLGDDANFMAP